MLDKYFSWEELQTKEQHKRLLAVQAALELIKAAATNDSVGNTISFTENELSSLADKIQAALDKK